MAAPEDDVARSVVDRWAALALDVQVPGSVYEETPPEPVPAATYAVLEVRANPEEDWRTCPYVAGSTYVAFHVVTLRVYGARQAVSTALSAIDAGFHGQTWSVPNATMIAPAVPASDRDTRREPRKKSGTDVWVGLRQYEVLTQRTVG